MRSDVFWSGAARIAVVNSRDNFVVRAELRMKMLLAGFCTLSSFFFQPERASRFMGALLSRNDPLAVGRAGGVARGCVGVSSFVCFLLYMPVATGELRTARGYRGLCASCWSPCPFFCLRLDEADSSLLIYCWLLTRLQSCGCVVVVFPSSVTKGESAGLSAKASELAKHAM